jgi:hypothetical protein
MKTLKRSLTLIMLLTLIIGSRTSAQDLSLEAQLKKFFEHDRAKEVVQDNEYTHTGFETGNFLCNPLLLNGEPVDYSKFNQSSTGELTVIKGAVKTGETIHVPFFVYLRRNGIKFFIPGKEKFDLKQTKIDLAEILKYARPGDHLVIEAVRKEDGAVKRILKLPGDGC